METYHASFTIQVRVNLLLKGGLVHVARADGDTDGDGLLLCLACDVLEDGNTGVDTPTLLEKSADGAT